MTTAMMDPTDKRREGEKKDSSGEGAGYFGAAEQQKCVTVIFNPVSGKTNPEARKKAISDALAGHGYTCQFIATTPEQGAKALAEQAIREGVDLIAVSGGDGTVMEVLSALVGTDIPVAVLPAGTGNLLSANLGIPMSVPEAVEVALSGESYRLDLARTADGRYFAIMGGMGLDGQVIQEADRAAKNRLGIFAYFWAAVKNLGRRRTRVWIRLDNRRLIRRRVKSVLIANMGKLTGGLEAIPTAAPNDGRLDVSIVNVTTMGGWFRLLWYTLLGRAHDAPELEVYQAQRVRIHSLHSEPVQFDGEDGGRRHDLLVRVVPGAVRILLPPNSPAARDAADPAPPEVIARRTANRRFVYPAVASLLVVAAAGTAFYALRRRKRRA